MVNDNLLLVASVRSARVRLALRIGFLRGSQGDIDRLATIATSSSPRQGWQKRRRGNPEWPPWVQLWPVWAQVRAAEKEDRDPLTRSLPWVEAFFWFNDES